VNEPARFAVLGLDGEARAAHPHSRSMGRI